MNDALFTKQPISSLSGGTRWRIGLLVTTLVMGAALVTSGVDRYFAAKANARAVAEAEIFSALSGARREVARGVEKNKEFLTSMYEDGIARGITYLAVINRDGGVAFSMGEPVVPLRRPVHERGMGRGMGQEIIHLDEAGVVQAYTSAGFKSRGRGPRRAGKTIAIELRPVEAQNIVSSAMRALMLEIGAATFLLVAAGVFWRMSRKSERMAAQMEAQRMETELQLERDRQLKMLGQMSAVLGHEVRNPLTALKGNAQLLLEAMEEDDPLRAKATRVVDGAVQLETLTGQVLDFAKTGALSFSKVYLDDLANSAVTFSDAEPVEVVLPKSAGDAEPWWVMDRSRMEQVLVNLLRNARQATGDDTPVELEIETGEGLVIRVKDRGAGIRPGDEDRIFEPFVTGRAKGTGLGLALVKRIVDSHGGTARASNRDGGGAVFSLALPRRSPEEER